MIAHDDEQGPAEGGHGSPARPATGPGFTVRDRRIFAPDAAGGEDAEPTPRLPTFIEGLQAELAAAARTAAEKDVKLRAIVAAYQDEVTKGLEETRARLARDAEKELGLARGEMALRFLEVRDNLTRSLAAAAGGARPDALLAGLQLVVAQFDAALGALGLERIEAAGAPFDPALHEAVTLVADRDPARAGTVVAEIQAGYRLAGRVVRPARVAVGRLPS